MEGLQLSTLAESRPHRDVWGCDVIGMTNMPEAKLAREAELCYATVAMVTNYDCWHPNHVAVEVATIVETLQASAAYAKALVHTLAGHLEPEACVHGCDRAFDTALIMARKARDPVKMKRLEAITARALSQ